MTKECALPLEHIFKSPYLPRIAHCLARVTIARVLANAIEGQQVKLGVQHVVDASLVAKIFEVDQVAFVGDLGRPWPEVMDRLGNVGCELLSTAFAQQLESSFPVHLLCIKDSLPHPPERITI